jgi:hypothetical protein
MAFLVDVPDARSYRGQGLNWSHVATFDTKDQAVAWIRGNIGSCDDDGNVCLITDCPQDDD